MAQWNLSEIAVRHENKSQWLNGTCYSIAEVCKPVACVQGSVLWAAALGGPRYDC